MSNLIGTQDNGISPPRRGVQRVSIDGIVYANSAAKFWPSLLEEAVTKCPAVTHVELTALICGRLSREDLFPEQRFARELERFLEGRLATSWEETLAELDLVGPPGAVILRVLHRRNELFAGDLPLDALDADLFPYVTVWLLEWAGLHPGRWNDETVRAALDILDPDRGKQYALRVRLRRRHLSEGLFRCTLRIAFRISG